MHLKITVYGLLGELLKKDIPREACFYKTGPVSLKEALAEVGLTGNDLQWIAVEIDGELAKKDILDDYLDKDEVEISVYPVFAGG